ncbi:MAG: SRPBCC family protein [Pirellulales bacterium]|nr:SRPBCC family protein [Pirellulales bacterium]
MKNAWKWLVGALVVLVGAALLVPALLPSRVHVERSTVISKPPAEVFAVVSDLNRYAEWDPFSRTDPTSKSTVTGAGQEAVYTWQGEQTGRGQMQIAGLDPPRRVDFALETFEPMAAKFQASYLLEPAGAGTKMSWTYDGEMDYFGRYFGLMMDGMLGPLFEQGLDNIKTLLEKP